MADLLSFCYIGQVAQNTPPGEGKIANRSQNFFSFVSYGLGCPPTAACYWPCSWTNSGTEVWLDWLLALFTTFFQTALTLCSWVRDAKGGTQSATLSSLY